MKILAFLLAISFATKGSSEKDYSQYHSGIMAIEELWAKEDFKEALHQYKALFKTVKRPMAKDAYNACQLAAYLNDPGFNAQFGLCAKLGVEYSRLIKSEMIATKFKEDSITLRKLYQNKRKEFLSRIDTLVTREWKNRFSSEQKLKGGPQYEAVCLDNFKRIEEAAKHKNFLGESRISLREDLTSYIQATMLHYPYSYTKLKEELWQAVLDGELAPLVVIYVYSFNQSRTGKLYTPEIKPDTVNFKSCYNLPFGWESANMEKVDQERRLKFISSLAVHNRIMALGPKYKLEYNFGF